MWWFGDFVKDFLAIWIVLDPIAAVPVFMALVADYDERTRAQIAGGSVIGLAVETHCQFHRPLAFPDPIDAGLDSAGLAGDPPVVAGNDGLTPDDPAAVPG